MASKTLTSDKGGWAMNISSDDATSSHLIYDAPATGNIVVLKEVHITAADAAIAFIQEQVSATATATRLLGPLYIAADTGYQDKFMDGIRATASTGLYLDTSGADSIQAFAAGRIV